MENLLHRKESIILTTVQIINELGIQGLTTREIARREELSEGALFRHFRSKNEVLLGVLDHYSQYDKDIMLSIELKKLKPIEAIKYFVSVYAEYHENYPEITAITQSYDVLACDQNLAEKIKNIFNERINFLKNMIDQAKKTGEIDTKVDSDYLSHVIMGLSRSICLEWRFKNYRFSLKEKTVSALEMILSALKQ